MKRFIIALCVFYFVSGLALGQGGNRSSDEQELLKARREWYDAFHRRDAAALARIEIADFAVISSSNISNKRQYENFERAAKENRVMPRGTEIIDDEGLRVRWQGEMAIISGSRWTKIPGQVEQPPQNKTAATEIWVKRDGRWRVMHLHYHQLQPPSSPVQGPQNQGGVEQPDAKLGQELIALRKAWVEARKRGDAETMSRLMADEWTVTTPEGYLVTKEQSLTRAKAGTSRVLPDPSYDNVTARAYGETAILTFRAKNETGYTRQLEVYVKRQGRWQWVAGQSTKLAEQQPQ